MICVSLGNISFNAILEILAQVKMAELRLDLLNLSDDQIKEIFSSHQELIVTFRPGKVTEEKRKSILLEAIAFGARYVDLEFETDDFFLREIKDSLTKRNGQLIISYHNEQKTLATRKLLKIVTQAFNRGADIAKIACWCSKLNDNSRLLSLTALKRSILVCGLGPLGIITRIAAPLCGAPFTYAFWEGHPPTAPGQLSYQQLKKIYELCQLENDETSLCFKDSK